MADPAKEAFLTEDGLIKFLKTRGHLLWGDSREEEEENAYQLGQDIYSWIEAGCPPGKETK